MSIGEKYLIERAITCVQNLMVYDTVIRKR